MHTDRANRLVIMLVGLIALALGVGGLLAGGGVFGRTLQHKQLVANNFSRYFAQHGDWLWPAIAAFTLVIVLFALFWLVCLLFSTDRAGDITLPAGERKKSDDGAGGSTTMTSAALVRAVIKEIETYHGVTGARGRILGEAANPTLAIEVTVSRRAELRTLVERIEEEAISHARISLEKPELPVRLDISVRDKVVARAS